MSLLLVSRLCAELRNGTSVSKKSISFGHKSKFCNNILSLIKDLGFIENFQEVAEEGQKPHTIITPRYYNKRSSITDIQLASKPSLPVYLSYQEIPYFYDGLGFCLLSTNKGIITDRTARELKCGGLILLKIF